MLQLSGKHKSFRAPDLHIRKQNLNDAESNIVFLTCVCVPRFIGAAEKQSRNTIMGAELQGILHTKGVVEIFRSQ